MNQDQNPYAAPLAELADVIDPDSDAEAIRREHINHEASVRSISLLYFIGAGIFLISSASFLFLPSALSGMSRSGTGMPGPSELTIILLMLLIMVGLAALAIAIGIGLRRLSRWVRIPVGLLSAVGLLQFPIGTLINAYVLYVVFCKKGNVVFSDDYKEIIRQTPHIKYRTSRIVIALFILLLLLLGVGLLSALFVG